MPEQIDFLAVLVFDRGSGWVNIQPHTFTASHPEIAYQLAVTEGQARQGNQRFAGLSELKVIEDDGPKFGEMKAGNPADLVKEKAELSAFQDPKWRGVPCDPEDLEATLQAPVIAFEPQGLSAVNWGRLSHAYGSAQNVPVYLRSLGAEEPEIRGEALQALIMTILHQGSLYSATVAAVPFLLRLVAVPSYPDRLEVMDFVQSIVKECCFESYRKWHGAIPLEGDEPAGDVDGDEPDLVAAVAKVLWADLELLTQLQADGDPYIRDMATYIVKELNAEADSS